jgi:hypothetical protein
MASTLTGAVHCNIERRGLLVCSNAEMQKNQQKMHNVEQKC